METIELPSAAELRKAKLSDECMQKQKAGWTKIKNELIMMNRGGRTETTFYRRYMMTRYNLPIGLIMYELSNKGYRIEAAWDGFGNIDYVTAHWD